MLKVGGRQRDLNPRSGWSRMKGYVKVCSKHESRCSWESLGEDDDGTRLRQCDRRNQGKQAPTQSSQLMTPRARLPGTCRR